ncbi:SDR family NAD(P)-dependent oxidoreductase [Methylocapsa sp. S129]|uniref:SDR family NAD(P)-dependent oxidoreductase n=1 Tax=Methylocapsa sp. S129 TaxID=1641869 RepID=UPI00131CAAB2|nr:SDR family NAD(P)-dependent oxidoreductase [Methylocapsa sp. S129]
MPLHPALTRDRVAVVTGAASGIGLAAAIKLAELGLKLCLADVDAAALDRAAAEVARHAASPANVRAVVADVSRREDVQRLKDQAYESFGEVAFLMNNAGVKGGGGLLGDPARWRKILDVNLWGVIHGVQVFAPAMIAQRTPCAIVNTGSKQGITCPPGETAYNVAKAGVKVVTEALAHELRNIEGCAVTAHLLVPGFTFTGFTKVRVAEKPAAAWTPEQVIDFMLAAMTVGDFYILCPDNDVTRAIDERRILWAAQDLIENRPALSRWHPDFKQAFADFMKAEREG